MNLCHALLVFGREAGFATSAEDWTPLNSDRPGHTFSSSTANSGALLLESEFDWNPKKDLADEFSIPILLRYGVTDRLEVNAGSSIFFEPTVQRSSAFEVGARFQWFQGDRFKANLHGRFQLAYPSSDARLAVSWLGTNFTFIDGKWSTNLSVFGYHLNPKGFERRDYEPYTDMSFVLSFKYQANEKWSGYIDYALSEFWHSPPFLSQELYYFKGVSWVCARLINPNLQIDVAADIPFNFGFSAGKVYVLVEYISLGATWRIIPGNSNSTTK